MTGFIVRTKDEQVIRFQYYLDAAPVTAAAFIALLPFSRIFMHARVSGQEVWTDEAPVLDIMQENASVMTLPGEIVIGPLNPSRLSTSKCMGIYYGNGKGLDACNIFGKVFEEDLSLLQTLGEQIWRNGIQQLTFDVLPEQQVQ
jgi:hypothetical protein